MRNRLAAQGRLFLLSVLNRAISWTTGLGAITHITGPSDQDTKIASGSTKSIELQADFANGGVVRCANLSGTNRFAVGDSVTRVGSGVTIGWSSNAQATGAGADTGLARVSAAVVKASNGSTGYGRIQAHWPRREFGVAKTPGTGATVTAYGGAPTHTLSGTAANLSDSTGHYVQLTASGAATAGVDIATTECLKTEIAPIVTFVVKPGATLPIATERIWVGFASASLATADSPTGAHVMAFRYAPTADATAFWRCVTNDGGADTGTETTTTAAIAVSTRYVLTIDATDSASIKFYVDGALVATHTTNLPTATTAMGAQALARDVAGDADKLFSISVIHYETN
jgi:hypothetical protein